MGWILLPDQRTQASIFSLSSIKFPARGHGDHHWFFLCTRIPGESFACSRINTSEFPSLWLPTQKQCWRYYFCEIFHWSGTKYSTNQWYEYSTVCCQCRRKDIQHRFVRKDTSEPKNGRGRTIPWICQSAAQLLKFPVAEPLGKFYFITIQRYFSLRSIKILGDC